MERVLHTNDDFGIRTNEPVHSGKVRAVYWLTPADSRRLISERGYDCRGDAPLAIMIVSDRLSAFDCIWHAENGLYGVPGKGAALNAIAHHWFEAFRSEGLAASHVLEAPHPLVWVVQRAQPVMIEAIARQYITGSMWRAYVSGEREFCGSVLPEGLQRDQRLTDLMITPSTKGIITGLQGVPEADDANISHDSIARHWQAFGLQSPEDIALYQGLLRDGFNLISRRLESCGQLFVDTKFEFGYVRNASNEAELIYMDEVGTPDSSRMWDARAYAEGRVVENSKEGFRQTLLTLAPDADVLLNKQRMRERAEYARKTDLPEALFLDVSETYRGVAETIIGHTLQTPERPREEVEQVLSGVLGLL